MNLIEAFLFQDTMATCDVIILPSAFRKSGKMLDMFLPTLVWESIFVDPYACVVREN